MCLHLTKNNYLTFSRQIIGYADEEDRHATEAESLQNQNQKPKRSSGFMPPSPPSPEIHDIVDDNLAADFDGSLSGLGVDIHTASFRYHSYIT